MVVFCVYKAVRDTDKSVYAVKTLLYSFGDEATDASFKNEVRLSSEIRGEHVIHYIYAHDSDEYPELPPYIIMEYAKLLILDLRKLLRNLPEPCRLRDMVHYNILLLKLGNQKRILFKWIFTLWVYGRFFKLYLYTAIAPVPLSTFAGEPSQSIGRSFIKSYAAVCLEGAIIVLACIIFSLFAATPPAVDPNLAAVSMVWSYIGELIFNMLVLVGAVKMADRVVREMMGL